MQQSKPRIYGEKIFFNFIELPFSEIKQQSHLISQIQKRELDGFVVKDVFSAEEINQLKDFLNKIPSDHLITTSSGKIFPAPFANLTDNGENLEFYYQKLALLDNYKTSNAALQNLSEKLDAFFRAAGSDYRVMVPTNKIKRKPVVAGTFRFFYPDMGGLHVHCGNLFQCQFPFYYTLIENDIDMNDQLSYFMVLQQPEKGGELTIYDMLWDTVKRKSSPEENTHVIDDNGNIIFLKDRKSFSVNPNVGDILVFAGGPIWHRVENIKGSRPRITYGGFLNFSKNKEELYYWA